MYTSIRDSQRCVYIIVSVLRCYILRLVLGVTHVLGGGHGLQLPRQVDVVRHEEDVDVRKQVEGRQAQQSRIRVLPGCRVLS